MSKYNNLNSTITKTELDVSTLTMADIIDIDFLQRFQDSFALGVGLTAVSVDVEGNLVTRPSFWSKFCMEYTRKSEAGGKGCMECDRKGGEQAARTGKPAIYECHAGLIDFAAPIMIEGRQIGSILGGQVLTSPPEESKYRKIARDIGVNEDEYIEALKEIPILSRERIEAVAETLFMVANNISNSTYQRLNMQKIAETLSDNSHQISATIEELAASASQVCDNQNQLNDEIKNVDTITGKINEVMDFIKDIADETRLLGLNAAIEAARAGQAGLGFGVVAQEIRKLSADSKETVGRIRILTTNIKESVDKTVSMGSETTSTVEQQAAAIQEVAASVEEITCLTQELNNLAHKK